MFLVDHFVEDLRKAFACFCCLLCFGPLLLIIGIWQFASAPGATLQRQALINSVNNQINIWNNVEPGFAASAWTANNFNLPVVHPNDEIPSVETLQSYKPAYFENTFSSVIAPARFEDNATPVSVTYSASKNNATGGAIISVRPFIVDTVNVKDSGSCNLGDYDSKHKECTNFYVLDSVCIKVSQLANSHQYTSDNRYGGIGCGMGSSVGGGSWQPATYRQVSYNGGNVYTTTYTFTDFSVRHADDPYIYFLSQGGSWPLTTAQKLLVGTVLMVIGGIFMLPCILFVIIGVVCFRRRKHHHHHENQRLVYA